MRGRYLSITPQNVFAVNTQVFQIGENKWKEKEHISFNSIFVFTQLAPLLKWGNLYF